MNITRVIFGRTTLSERYVFRNGDPSVRRPIVLSVFLIDTGDRRILVDAGCDTMPGFDVEDFIGPERALEMIGVSALDITDLVLTHSHHDHTESTHLYKNATVYVHRDEYPESCRFIPDGMRVELFTDEAVICDGVRAVWSGGHSLGSSVVEIDCGDETVVIVGDECYSHECFTRQIPTGSAVAPLRAESFIKKYSSPEYRVLITHEI